MSFLSAWCNENAGPDGGDGGHGGHVVFEVGKTIYFYINFCIKFQKTE